MTTNKSIASQRDQEYGVILPCSQSEFGEFISSLLGKPQTINRLYSGLFEIDKDCLTNIHHLINQRVSEQNEATLLQFTVRVAYDDKSSVLLTDVDDFIRYNEVSPRISLAAQLSWVYLIKFRDKHAPEKQEIELTFYSSDCYGKVTEFGLTNREGPFASMRLPGRFELSIKHTARSWGLDLEGLIMNHLRGLRNAESRFQKWISDNSELIGLWSGLLFYIGTILGAYFAAQYFGERLRTAAADHMTRLTTTDQKIQYLIDSVLTGAWPRFVLGLVLFFLINIIVATLIGVLIGKYANQPQRSFLLLTKETESLWKAQARRQRYAFAKFIGTFALAVAVGIISNLLFFWVFA